MPVPGLHLKPAFLPAELSIMLVAAGLVDQGEVSTAAHDYDYAMVEPTINPTVQPDKRSA
jgi:hypothetical protein